MAQYLGHLREHKEAIARFLRDTVSYEPLSYNQLGMWTAYEPDRQSAAYNLALVLNMKHPSLGDEVERAFRGLLEKYPILSAKFAVMTDRPEMILENDRVLKIPRRKFSSEADLRNYLETVTAKPFELEKHLPFRVEFLHLGEQIELILTAFHHIVVEYLSLDVLKLELTDRLSRADGAADDVSVSDAFFEFVREEKGFVSGVWRRACVLGGHNCRWSPHLIPTTLQ